MKGKDKNRTKLIRYINNYAFGMIEDTSANILQRMCPVKTLTKLCKSQPGIVVLPGSYLLGCNRYLLLSQLRGKSYP
jgi:hypothetical protein